MAQRMTQFYEFGRFTLDVQECRLLRDGLRVPLKPKVFETLILLVENSGHMMDKDELMKRLWPDTFVEEANLAVNISQLRKVLGEAENGEQYIETIPKRGYRFNAPVSEVMAEPVDLIVRESVRSRIVIEEEESASLATSASLAATAGSLKPITTPSTPWLGIKDRRLLVTLPVLLIVIVTAGYLMRLRRSGHALAKPSSLAVLPFRNLKPNAETDFIGLSMADAITTRLSGATALTVRPSAYADNYRNQSMDPRKAAEELNADELLTGSYVKEGDDLRISAQLIDVSANQILWNDTEDVKYGKLPAFEDQVSLGVAHALELKLTPAETERLKQEAPHDELAYEDYLRGRFLISTNNHQKAVETLESSVARDPNYALAWAYLGKAYSVTASQYLGGGQYRKKAEMAYDKALALKPEDPETLVLIANFLTENNRVEEAVPILREVTKTHPNYPFAHWELSYAYRYAGTLNPSIEEGERALQLYPNITGHLFNSYLYAGQYQKFIDSLPSRQDAYFIFYRGLGYYYLKDFARATAYFDRAYELDSSAIVSHIGKALSLASAGKHRQGLELLKAIDAKAEDDGASDGEISYKLAQVYAVLGDKPSALRKLQSSIEQGFFCYGYFISDPLTENLRAENKYLTLMEKAEQRHEEFKRRFF